LKTPVGLGFLGKLLSPNPQLAIVPIPQSNPTLGTGLTLAAIYFHPQSFGGNFDLGEGPLEKITTPELDATSVGVGVLVQRDTRDNRFNAYKGSILQLDGTVYGEAIGGDFDYQSVDLRYRYRMHQASRL
jgi:hypothetical protein